MEADVIFGDPNSFSISCSNNKQSISQELNDYCYWRLGNKLIGDPREPCYLPAWLAALDNFYRYRLPRILAFEADLDDVVQDIFTKQQDEWSDSVRRAWEIHQVSLDETQDAWLLMAHRKGIGIQFTWMGWREPCPSVGIGKVFSVWANTNLVKESIVDCLKNYKHSFPFTTETISPIQ
ncbi:MAG TPA: hypothetical protein VF629_14390 [Hymenobacter sp.]|jgi:hypothetical protein|uniref:hypothetical protein n=1 Tax=Hymenobacter sp. TaxID=1898978 RepID=UPI002ED791A2